MIAVGIDPGRHTGIAVVSWPDGATLPAALGAFAVWGEGDAWWCRARSAVQCTVAAYWQGESAPVPPCFIEAAPVTARGEKGRRPGMAAWYGLGRMAGRMEAIWYEETYTAPIQVAVSAWRGAWGPQVISAGATKADLIRIAGYVISGAGAAIRRAEEEGPKGIGADVAEAMLIAGGGCFLARKTNDGR